MGTIYKVFYISKFSLKLREMIVRQVRCHPHLYSQGNIKKYDKLFHSNPQISFSYIKRNYLPAAQYPNVSFPLQFAIIIGNSITRDEAFPLECLGTFVTSHMYLFIRGRLSLIFM